MHHPGPPRFVSVGERIELAPWNPDPTSSFGWRVVDAPEGSETSVGTDPVVDFEADTPGVYRVALESPEGSHELTIRAFPDNGEQVRIELPTGKVPRERADVNRILEDIGAQEDIEEYVRTPGPGRPTVRIDATHEVESVVVEANASAASVSEYDDDDIDIEFYVDDRDDADLAVSGRQARIAASDIDDLVRVYAVAVGERHSVADVVRLERSDDGIEITRPNDPPEWACDATVYEIYVRAFAADDVETTFAEIEKRIPYLEHLGVDCVWFTPVLETTSSSGYQTQDYFDTASDLGSREAFESLVTSLHRVGIQVLFDLVINHSGYNHPLFQMSAAGVEEYRDWYVWNEDGEYEYYFNWGHLPNFNYRNLAVRRYLHSIVDEWAGVVDGFRCDVAWGTPHGFWKEVHERVKAEHPDFLLLDEVLPRDARYHEMEFDIHHDMRLFHALRRIGSGAKPAGSLLDAARAPAVEGFPEHALHLRFIENHDFERYAEACDREALKAAAAAVFTLPGVPMIYYGQERGVEGSWDDMIWSGGDNDLTEHHRRLIAARSEHEVLRRGDLVDVEWDADSHRIVAFGREDVDGRVVVALNFGSEPADVVLDEPIDGTDLLSGEDVAATDGVEGTTVTVDDAVVLRA